MTTTNSVSDPKPAPGDTSIASMAADIVALSHLFNGISSAAAVSIGYFITIWHYGEPVSAGVFISAFLATLCISNGGFIVNDILDLEIDRINRPDRPLAAGRISIRLAWALYVLYTLVGLGFAFAINSGTAITALIIAAGLFLYSYRLKRVFVVGHITIAALSMLMFPFGGIAAGHILPVLYSAPVVFAAFFAREVLKTVPDAEGDRANGVVNLTTRYGVIVSTRLAQVVLIFCAAALPLLRLVWSLNSWFLVADLLIVWPLVGYLVLRLSPRSDPDHKNVNTVLRLSKLLFLLVALALLIGTFNI